jgi:hypothetical protein
LKYDARKVSGVKRALKFEYPTYPGDLQNEKKIEKYLSF